LTSHDKGHWQRGYSVAEKQAVLKVMFDYHIGPTNGTTVAVLAKHPDLKGTPERSIRQILGDADGDDCCLGWTDRGDGVVEETYVCQYREQTLAATERMKKTVATTQARIERREKFAAGLPWGRRPPDQGDLF
jgi:hypothetical protein